MSHTRPPYRSDNSIEARESAEAERRAEIIRAWLLGYAYAQRELGELLEHRSRWPRWWRSRARAGTRG